MCKRSTDRGKNSTEAVSAAIGNYFQSENGGKLAAKTIQVEQI